MLWNEYLLTCLVEELAETSQEVCKCLRFTSTHTHPGSKESNLDKLSIEFSQVIAVIEMLNKEGVKIEVKQDIIDDKKKRLLMYAKRSKQLGVIKQIGTLK